MKNSEIHKGLDKKEIRDFLALALVKCIEELMDNSKQRTRSIQIYKNIQAFLLLIKVSGWEEFDVIDETEGDIKNHLVKMSFIGTQKEYEFLLTKINKG